ncbi:histone H3.v1-like [Salvia divinorum]|uniref:Histone H3.v1-like n=1 Tax=Salvia divinorum TaxID=28513 RepID=A0ABD1HTN6_SALDI
MVVWMIELISLAASNSLAVFCFCNVLIAILVIGSSQTSSEPDEMANPTIVHLKQIPEEKESSQSVSIDMVNKDDDEEEEEDELRKRVEEFIEKTNRGWEAEKRNRYKATLIQ